MMLGAGGRQGQRRIPARARPAMRGAKAGTPGSGGAQISPAAICSTDVSFSLRRRRGAGRRRAGRPGPGGAVRLHRRAFAATIRATILAQGRELKLRHPADAIRAGLVLVPANRLTGAAAAALDPRERRACLPSAASAPGGRSPWRRSDGGSKSAVARLQIDTRAESRAAPPQRRQSAEGGDRPLARQRLQDPALLRSRRAASISAPSARSMRLVRELAARRSRRCCSSPRSCPEIPLACDRAIVLFGGRIVARDAGRARPTRRTLLRAAHGLVERRRCRHERRERRRRRRRAGRGRRRSRRALRRSSPLLGMPAPARSPCWR